MKNIKSKRKRRWVAFKQAIREFFFKLFAVRKITKTISNTYYALLYETGIEYTSLFMVPSDFKKYSNKQIEHALNILVKHKKLASWCNKIRNNADGYLLVLPTENRLERRILNCIPDEIDLNQVNVQPISLQPMETSAETPTQTENPQPAEETEPTPTNNNTQTAKAEEEHIQPTAGSELIDDGKPF